MGIIVFLVATIASIYWLNKFYRSLANDLPAASSRRRVVLIDNLPSVGREIPVVKPVAETPITATAPRLPERWLPIPPPDYTRCDRQSEILPNFPISPSSTEESLLFRSLVHGLLIVSLLTTDLAAGTHYSWVGIPWATVGAVWSWYRRHNAKHWLNIGVSGASLGIAIVFLAPILANQMKIAIENYPIPAAAALTKMSVAISIALGMLCTALQMGLSFHLYSRRVLGYGLVISVVLMGVAASLSQNLGFLILLCTFMAIAIPALMLDYRSKLALPPIGIATLPTRRQLPYQHLPWKYLSQVAAISLGLGLMLAVFLPNFHLPNLSFNPPEFDLNRLQTLAQKYPQPQADAPRSQLIDPPTPAPTIREIATQALGQPDNQNYPDVIKQENLQLPPELASKLQQFTQQILATSPQPLKSDFDRATYIAEYLKKHHPPTPQDRQQVAADAQLFQQFLAQCAATPKSCQLEGNKQDLAILYTSMLRSIDIPARLKTGDKLGEIDPQTKMYSRPQGEAHSHTEVYFPNWGWFAVDADPDRALFSLDPRQIDQLKQIAFAAAPIQPSPTPKPSAIPTTSPNQQHPSPTAQTTPTTFTPTPTQSPPFNPPANQSPSIADPVLLRIIITAIAICGAIAWYLWLQQHHQQQFAKLPPVEQIYRSMVMSLSKQGLVKRPTQTQREYADGASKIYPPKIAKIVQEISHIYTAWRYGQEQIDVKQLAKKWQYLQHLQQLAAKKSK
jgi:hypothetical protein